MIVKALELKGQIDEAGNLHLAHPIGIRNKNVKIIILVSEEDDLNDEEWLAGASRNEAFDFLMDEEEDIYSLNDGAPFQEDEV